MAQRERSINAHRLKIPGGININRDILHYVKAGKFDWRDCMLASVVLDIIDVKTGYATTNVHDLCLLMWREPKEETEASHRRLLEGGWIVRCCDAGCDGGYSHYTVSPSFGFPEEASLPAEEFVDDSEAQVQA